LQVSAKDRAKLLDISLTRRWGFESLRIVSAFNKVDYWIGQAEHLSFIFNIIKSLSVNHMGTIEYAAGDHQSSVFCRSLMVGPKGVLLQTSYCLLTLLFGNQNKVRIISALLFCTMAFIRLGWILFATHYSCVMMLNKLSVAANFISRIMIIYRKNGILPVICAFF
jgi:hypothetical protein